jgi:predicted O-methyltransferase YrrM
MQERAGMDDEVKEADTTLDALGILHGTDKSSRAHNYLTLYDQVLAPLRQSPARLLEIGVLGGASLRMWRDYFPRGRIVGLDRDRAALAHAGERIEVHQADQSDALALAALVGSLEPFDVMVDDGSHIWSHQIETLRVLLPLLKPGGIYILEDLHTSYGPWAPKYAGAGGETAASYCQRLAEQVLASAEREQPDRALARLARLLQSVTFARRAAIFRRKGG